MTFSNQPHKSDVVFRKSKSKAVNQPKLTKYAPHLIPIMDGCFSKLVPPKHEYSTSSYAELMEQYASEAFKKFPVNEHPLIELEHLSKWNHQFYFLSRGLGGGKSTAVLRHIRNQMLRLDQPAISFTHSRPIGESQKDKFLEDSELLGDKLCRCVTYYQGNKEENSQLRESPLNHTLIITTPFMYTGTLTHYSPMISQDHLEFLTQVKDLEAWQGLFETNNDNWFKALITPSVVFIDEVDSFPLPILYCLAVIVRLLINQNPNLQVILASGTISNPDNLIELFFGSEADCLVISGTGRRGNSTIDVFYEEKEHQLLHIAIEAIKAHIQQEISSLQIKELTDVPDTFNPAKCILFINDKLEIDIREIIGDFNEFFVTLHGNMNPDEMTDQLEIFNTNPLKICLVTTDILHAGFDPSNVVWGIFYGPPFNRRGFIQRKHRIIRNPHLKSHIDLILRSNNQDEKFLAESSNEEALKAYICQEDPPPFKVPLYVPLMIKYAIVLGLVFGNWKILEELRYSHIEDEDPDYGQYLQRTYIELLVDNIIAQAPQGAIRPTRKTKQWIWDFPHNFQSDCYLVKIKEKNKKQQILGKVNYLTLLRYSLPRQTLPFIDENYRVAKINRDEKEVFVTSGIQELHYYKNKLAYANKIKDILSKDHLTGTALTEVTTEVYVAEVDQRTEYSNLDEYTLRKNYRGVFLPGDFTDKNKQHLADIYEKLNLNPAWFRIQSISDDQLGKGTLHIDETGLNLAQMVYLYLVDSSDYLNIQKEKKEKDSS